MKQTVVGPNQRSVVDDVAVFGRQEALFGVE